MHSEMVRRVARAIHADTKCVKSIWPYRPFDELTEMQQSKYFRRARAALQAMREPTGAMAAKWTDVSEIEDDNDCAELWRLMIDAALKD